MASRQGSLCRLELTPAWLTVGLDEAGRGCLAGPVVASAVILPGGFKLTGLGDSKKLSPARREQLACDIKARALAWSLSPVWPRRIEIINILNATLEAMTKAVAALPVKPELLLIDGNVKIRPEILARFLDFRPRQQAIAHGDALVPAISAASILAKTWRDKLMTALARRWPRYGFERHKGYGTKEHLAALREFGPCPLHRLTFRGVCPEERLP